MRFEGEVSDECFDSESTANLWAINWFIYEEHNFTGSYGVIETFFLFFVKGQIYWKGTKGCHP